MSCAENLVRAAVKWGNVLVGFDIDTSTTVVLPWAVVGDLLRHCFLIYVETCAGCRVSASRVSQVLRLDGVLLMALKRT